MKRSLQEVVELVVFGLIALLIGTGVLWLLGWVFGLVGLVLKFLAGLIWWLLRYIVPVAIVAGLVYFLVRVAQGDRKPATAQAGVGPAAPATPPLSPVEGAPAPATDGTGEASAGEEPEPEGTAEGEAGTEAEAPSDAGADAPDDDKPDA